MDNTVYRFNDSTFHQVGVAVGSLSASSDGTVLATNINTKAIWKYVSDNNWVNLTPGFQLQSTAVVNAYSMYGIGTDANIYWY